MRPPVPVVAPEKGATPNNTNEKTYWQLGIGSTQKVLTCNYIIESFECIGPHTRVNKTHWFSFASSLLKKHLSNTLLEVF